MKIYLVEQRKRFNTHLKYFKSKVVMNTASSKLRAKNTEIVTNSPYREDFAVAILNAYQIFPESIITAYCEWKLTNREIRPGDVIVQQVYLPPLKRFSVKAIMGVRVREVIMEADRVGFSYETLNGHAERGTSTFTIEKRGEGTVFRIQTFSRPANPLFGFLARPYQAFCTRKALHNVKRQLEKTSRIRVVSHSGGRALSQV